MTKVVALRDGFYDGKRRRKGAQFLVPDGATATWFTPLAAFKAPVAEEKPAEDTLSAINKTAAEAEEATLAAKSEIVPAGRKTKKAADDLT